MGIGVATLPLPRDRTFKNLPIYASLCHLKTSKKPRGLGELSFVNCKVRLQRSFVLTKPPAPGDKLHQDQNRNCSPQGWASVPESCGGCSLLWPLSPFLLKSLDVCFHSGIAIQCKILFKEMQNLRPTLNKMNQNLHFLTRCLAESFACHVGSTDQPLDASPSPVARINPIGLLIAVVTFPLPGFGVEVGRLTGSGQKQNEVLLDKERVTSSRDNWNADSRVTAGQESCSI